MLPEDFPLGPEAIAQLMKAAGYNQTRLATRLGVTSGAVSKWVNGLSRPSHEHEAALRAIEPRPGKSKSWAEFLAHVDATIAANRQQRPASAEPAPAAPGAGTAPTLAPEAIAPAKLRVPVRRLARRLSEALGDQLDTLRSKLDEAAAKRETDKHEIISEVRAARRTLNGHTFEIAEEGSALSEAKAEAASAKTEQAFGAVGAHVEATSAETEQALGAVGAHVEAASAETEQALGAVGGANVEAASAKTEQALGPIGGRVEAASAKTQEALGAVGARVEAASAKTQEALGAVGAKIEAASAKTGEELTELAAKVGDAGHILWLVHAQQGKVDGRVRTLGQILLGLICVVALGFSALVLVAWRNGTMDLFLDFYEAPGIHGEMGESKTGKPVPDHPLSGQLRSPCAMGATTIAGGCWIEVANQKPPCLPGFYYSGTACYLPAGHVLKPEAKLQPSPTPE